MRLGNKLWNVLFSYAIASMLLLFVYETYIRSYIVETFSSSSSIHHAHDSGFSSSIMNMNGHNYRHDQRKRRKATAVVASAAGGYNNNNYYENNNNDNRNNKNGRGRNTQSILQLDEIRNKDRIHTCTLPGNETIMLTKSPDLIIAGAQKGGTSAFYFLLREHPNFLPSRKFESHFFDWQFAVPPKDLDDPAFWAKFNASTEDELLCAARKQYIDENFSVNKLLTSKKVRITYEKTPNYMFIPQVPELVYKVCPWHPKIILILRNPVDRAYSHFMMDFGKQRIDENFETYIQLELETMREVGLTNIPKLKASSKSDNNALLVSNNNSSDHLFYNPPNNMTQDESDHAHWMVYRTRHMRNYLQRGIYSVQLERWMKFFPLNESLMVIDNERLHAEPRKVMREVMKFLAAPKPDYYEDEDVSVSFQEEKELQSRPGVSNVLSVGGYPPMSNTTRRFLEKFYKPYNDQLAGLLGEEWKGIWNDQPLTVSTT